MIRFLSALLGLIVAAALSIGVIGRPLVFADHACCVPSGAGCRTGSWREAPARTSPVPGVACRETEIPSVHLLPSFPCVAVSWQGGWKNAQGPNSQTTH